MERADAGQQAESSAYDCPRASTGGRAFRRLGILLGGEVFGADIFR